MVSKIESPKRWHIDITGILLLFDVLSTIRSIFFICASVAPSMISSRTELRTHDGRSARRDLLRAFVDSVVNMILENDM